MAIKVVSWNIEGRLTRFTKKGRGSPEHILKTIKKMNADVVFLAEASDGDDIEPAVAQGVKSLGYEVRTASYDDGSKDRKWAAEVAPNMKLLSRLPIQQFTQIRLGDIRNAMVVEVNDPESGHPLRIFGIHLDDRNEANRLSQLDDLIPLVQSSPMPLVVMGDFNAMHADSRHARIYKSEALATLAKYWPHERTKDGWCRLIEMANGDTLKKLEIVTDLVDADSSYSPTETPKMRSQEWMPSIRLGQIDHMFVSPGVTVTGFRVGRDGGSDHRPLSAILEVIDKNKQK